MHALLYAMILALYLIPTWIARNKNHPNVGAIFAINLLFGWTWIGFGIAMIWAMRPQWQIKGLAPFAPLVGRRARRTVEEVRNMTRAEPYMKE
jgi:hypothetical protein